MGLLGQWSMTYLDDTIKNAFRWNVTFLPRARVQTTAFGGTPVVAWKKTRHSKEAAAFLEFFTSVEMMTLFDEMGSYVPVRADMLEQKLTFQVRDDLMQVFHQQIKALPAHYVAFVARSYSSGLLNILGDEMGKMMREGQSPEETARNVEARGNTFIQQNPDVEVR
jgi:multiple sugar transport system substrate-binding protein